MNSALVLPLQTVAEQLRASVSQRAVLDLHRYMSDILGDVSPECLTRGLADDGVISVNDPRPAGRTVLSRRLEGLSASGTEFLPSMIVDNALNIALVHYLADDVLGFAAAGTIVADAVGGDEGSGGTEATLDDMLLVAHNHGETSGYDGGLLVLTRWRGGHLLRGEMSLRPTHRVTDQSLIMSEDHHSFPVQSLQYWRVVLRRGMQPASNLSQMSTEPRGRNGSPSLLC